MSTTQQPYADISFINDPDRIRFAANAAGIGIWEVDLATNTVLWDSRCCELFGISSGNIIPYEEAIRYIHPDDVGRVDEAVQAAVRGEDGGRYDATYRTIGMEDGKLRWVNFSGNAYFGAAGQIIRFGGIAQEVTNKVVQEEALRQITTLNTSLKTSEQRFRTVFEQSPLLFTVLSGPNLVVEAANEKVLQMWRTDASVIGRPVNEILPEMDSQPFMDLLRRVYCTGEPFSAHAMPAHLMRNGVPEDFYFDFTYAPVRDGENTVTGVVVLATDVTDRELVRREAELKGQQMLSLFERSRVGIVVFDRQLVFRSANRFYCELMDRSHEEVIGRQMLEVFPEVADQGFEALMDGVMTTGEPFFAPNSAVHLLRWGQQNTLYVDLAFHPLLEGDAVNGVIVIVTEASSGALAQRLKEAEENEARFRSLIKESPVATILMTGPELRIEVANEKMLASIGKSYDVVGMTLTEALPEMSTAFITMLHEVYATGQTVEQQAAPVEWVLDGERRLYYYDYTYKRITLGPNRYGVIVMAVDVTEQIKARQQVEELVVERTAELSKANIALQQSNSELARSNAYLEEFAHAASHDLKEPIRKIQVFTNRLKEQLNQRLNDEEAMLFDRIEKAGSRMGLLVDDLLLYSHVSIRPHQREEVNLAEVVQRVLEDLDLVIQEKEATVQSNPLPRVMGYRQQLQQLFQNLLSNALKYSRPDVPPAITITASEAEHGGQRYHCVEVRDNGIGFDPEYAERIFEMFARLHGKHEYEGTGIGLSIVRKVAENHGGFVRAEGIKEGGARFSVWLPA